MLRLAQRNRLPIETAVSWLLLCLTSCPLTFDEFINNYLNCCHGKRVEEQMFQWSNPASSKNRLLHCKAYVTNHIHSTLSAKHEVIKVSATATSELSLDCGLCISANVFELGEMENHMGPSQSTHDMRQLEVSIMCITTIIIHHSGKSLGKNV